MGFILGFVGFILVFIGILVAFVGNWGTALTLLSLGLSMLTISGVKTPPAWAFKHAHRMSKPVWLLIAIVSLVPPFGLITCVMWIIFGRAVERAWATGDPAAYGGYLARKAAIRAAAEAAGSNQDAYRKGLDEGRRGW